MNTASTVAGSSTINTSQLRLQNPTQQDAVSPKSIEMQSLTSNSAFAGPILAPPPSVPLREMPSDIRIFDEPPSLEIALLTQSEGTNALSFGLFGDRNLDLAEFERIMHELETNPEINNQLEDIFKCINRHSNSFNLLDKNYLTVLSLALKVFVGTCATMKGLITVPLTWAYHGVRGCLGRLPRYQEMMFGRARNPEELREGASVIDRAREFNETNKGSNIGVEIGIALISNLVINQIKRYSDGNKMVQRIAGIVSLPIAYVILPFIVIAVLRSAGKPVSQAELAEWHNLVSQNKDARFWERYNRLPSFVRRILNRLSCAQEDQKIYTDNSIWSLMTKMTHAINHQVDGVGGIVIDRFAEIDNIAQIAREAGGLLSALAMTCLAEIVKAQLGTSPESKRLKVRALQQIEAIMTENMRKPKENKSIWIEYGGIIALRNIGYRVPHTTVGEFAIQNLIKLIGILTSFFSIKQGVEEIQYMAEHGGSPF